ncbi:MAG: D-alanyl-D-alanine carboxypeptidase [Rhodobacteraceae bacterium]|nr:D-alanyl-D-alanine carboxypeptidase [Paracoccaceae bacterium]
MRLRTVLAFAAIFLLSAGTGRAIQTGAISALVQDHNSGLILFEHNADQPLPPASLSKLMTLYMVFEALEDGRLSLDEKLQVSSAAKSKGGSTMFLDTRDRPTVEDLIRGVVVLSGNDACVVLAEALSADGTEGGFARDMTARARELGMTSTSLLNSTGLPEPDHLMSARDLVLLTTRLINDFPEQYAYFAETEFEFDGRAPANRFNRNPLLKNSVEGADGLKTGYTRDSGYGIAGSAIQDGSRVSFVLLGLDSSSARAQAAEKVVDWYRKQFRTVTPLAKGETVLEVPVWMGSQGTVGATIDRDLRFPVPFASNERLTANVTIEPYVEAPVTEGQKIGELVLEVPGFDQAVSLPLRASSDVDRGGLVTASIYRLKSLWQKYFPPALTPMQ